MLNSINTNVEKERNSNFELFRIILMILIVAHHYVLNSGMIELYDFSNITGNMIFLQVYGMFGKTIINCFTLITGYFMVKSNISCRKFAKVYLQVKFYVIFFFLIFVFFGYSAFSLKELIKTIFSVVYDSGTLYIGTYIIFYLFIPFLNIVAKTLKKRHFQILLVLLFVYYTVFSTFFLHDTFDFVGWMMTTYLIGAYISLYPCKWFESKKIALFGAVSAVVLMVMSILVVDYIGAKIGFFNYYHMMSDSNKLLAVWCSISFFLLFKNIEIKNNKFINEIASLTFGVLLFHANSDNMRTFLWGTLFRNVKFYSSKYLVLHALVVVIIVYVLGSVFEKIRVKCIEKPLFAWLDAKVVWNKYDEFLKRG